jgi:processive 1,2-diacylglycerol beta-glucosyltransferase
LKVLILSASIGGGHEMAARALKSGILKRNNNYVVKIVDALSYVSAVLNKTVKDTYTRMIKLAPKIYEVIYNKTNKDSKFSSLVVLLNKLFSRKLLALLKDFNPDIIIATHMFPTEMISYLKSHRKVNVPLVCVITDYAPHKTWIMDNVDAYVVASEDMLPKMIKFGINESKIYPFGIPVDDSFFKKKSKIFLLKSIGLNTNIPTILIMAGSFGVENITKIYKELVQSVLDFQIIIITGKNKRLYENLNKLISEQKAINPNFKKTKLIYFTEKVYKYMQTADLIITKPGGLTVSEALASELPLAVFDAIPGQEKENADFLIKNNMGVKISQNENCREAVENLLKNKEHLKIMKNNCKTHSEMMSKGNIYTLIENLVGNNSKTVLV